MDSVQHSVVTPSRGRFVRAIAKALHIQGIAPDDGFYKSKYLEKTKKGHFKHVESPTLEDEDEEAEDKMVKEAFLSKLFAGVSAVKAAYAEMQFAQFPHDLDGIQSADKVVISRLKHLSELKQSYLKKQFDDLSPAKTLLLSQLQEKKSTLNMYEIATKKMESLLKLKDSETIFLKDKLAEANKANKSLEKKLSLSGQFSVPENTRPGNFLSYHKQTLKSIRSFVQLMITEMESAGWDLDAAANTIEPGVRFKKPSHRCFAFESFVCRQMFDGFNSSDFSSQKPERDMQRSLFYDRFTELKSVKPADYLARKPKSPFATFCRAKYLKLVHPKMEASLFGSLDQRSVVTNFFSTFSEMAKRVWLLHCLAYSLDPEIEIFVVKIGSRFSEVYMESLSDDALLLSESDNQVALSVVPGFRVGKTVVQCQVYLCSE